MLNVDQPVLLDQPTRTDDLVTLDILAGEIGCRLARTGDLVIPYGTPFRTAAQMVVEWAGRRWALLLRTAISQLAETEDGKRQGRRGRDRT
jgi:hypothetical protein